MGFSSFEFATSLSIIALIGLIVFFIGGVLFCIVVELPLLWGFAIISKRLKKSQENGIDKPFLEMIQWKTVPKRIKQNTDIKNVYGSKRSN